MQRDLRSLLVNSSPLVLPLECRHPRKRLALLRVGAFVAQLSATRAHSNTAAPGMRRDCSENARPTCREHRPERRERSPGNANIHTQMQIQILTSISPFKTQNPEGKLRLQRTCSFARLRERNRARARALAGQKLLFTSPFARSAKRKFLVFLSYFRARAENNNTRNGADNAPNEADNAIAGDVDE